MTDAFITAWKARFEDTLPDGQELRQEWHGHWTRFHALPGSRAPAETPAEQAEYLRRANTLAAALFDRDTALWLVACHWTAQASADDAPPRFASEGFRLDFVAHWPLPPDYFEIPSVPVYAVRVRWQAGAFDPLLKRAAEDCGSIVLFAPQTGRAFAPYDGGFDLIAAPETLRALERRHAAWMSPREDRL